MMLREKNDDFKKVQDAIAQCSGYLFENVVFEPLNKDYNSYRCTFQNRLIHFRSAKITPIKMGQFVTFYKRDSSQKIVPYGISDIFDFLMISVRNNDALGIFVFPKSVLVQEGVIASHGVEGKRALRLYPSWDTPSSAQAIKTQRWQVPYFVHLLTSSSCSEKLSELLFYKIV